MAANGKQRKPTQEMAANIGLLKQLHADLQKARTLISQRKFEAAEKILTSLVNRESQYFGAWFLLGVLAYQKKQWMPAATYFSRAAMLNPNDEPTQLNLGRTYIEIEAYAMAEQTLRGVLARSPENADAHRALAKCYYEDKDYLAAVEALEQSLLRAPDSVETLHALASAHSELGNLDVARANYEKALKRAVADKKKGGNVPAIVSQLLGLPVASDLKALGREVQQQKKKLQGQTNNDTVDALAFAEARLLEQQGDFAGAWHVLEQVNARIWKTQKGENGGFRERMENSHSYADTLTPEALQSPVGKAATAPTPLFIVGASRSGKTTLERLLGASADVHKGYETKMVEHAITRTALQVGLPKLTDFWYLPENVDDVFAATFAEELMRKAQNAKIFTVTYPGSIHHAGRLARAVPNARFVFMTRNRDDQALRCFQKHYRRGNSYSYNWQACHEFLELYDDLAGRWVEKLGPRALHLTYEALVENPADAVGAIEHLMGASFAVEDLPPTGDDRGCSVPYRPFIQSAGA